MNNRNNSLIAFDVSLFIRFVEILLVVVVVVLLTVALAVVVCES